MKGVSRVVDPYGLYRSNGPLSIRTRWENYISLTGLEYFSPFAGVKGVSQVVDPYGSYRLNGPLSTRHHRKIESLYYRIVRYNERYPIFQPKLQ